MKTGIGLILALENGIEVTGTGILFLGMEKKMTRVMGME